MTREPCPTHQRRSFGEEVALVHELIAQGDRAHALHHCVSALGLDPDLPHWQAPLRELLNDGTLVERLRGDTFFGAQAALAFHLRENGGLAEAMDLVADIHRAVPHLGFHRWLAAWGEQARVDGHAVAAAPLVHAMLAATTFGVGRMRVLPAEREAAEELAPLARLALAVAPEEPSAALIASAVLRRAGRLQEALDAAERAKTTAPPEQYQISRGLALRGLGMFDAALEAFDAAFASSGDAVHLMEKVRVLADAGRWAEGLAVWTERNALQSPEGENLLEREALLRAARANAPPPDEPPLDIVRRRSLGHGRLWPMVDATANALRQVAGGAGLRAKGPTGAGDAVRSGTIKMTVSGPEGPSNRLCQALMMAGEPDPKLASYSASGEAVELAHEVTQYTLWRRDGDVIVQALPRPPEPVSDWIERISLRELDGTVSETEFETGTDFLDMWSIASRHAPPPSTARDWLAAAIYPRMPVIRVCSGPDWVFRWQVAALIGLAVSEPDWKATSKRMAFASLLTGPVDWPLAAAIRVCAEVALREPTATKEIRQTLIDLTQRLGREQNEGIVTTLLGALEMIPCVPAEFIDRLRSQLAGPEPPAPQAPKTKPRPWWKFWGPS